MRIFGVRQLDICGFWKWFLIDYLPALGWGVKNYLLLKRSLLKILISSSYWKSVFNTKRSWVLICGLEKTSKLFPLMQVWNLSSLPKESTCPQSKNAPFKNEVQKLLRRKWTRHKSCATKNDGQELYLGNLLICTFDFSSWSLLFEMKK